MAEQSERMMGDVSIQAITLDNDGAQPRAHSVTRSSSLSRAQPHPQPQSQSESLSQSEPLSASYSSPSPSCALPMPLGEAAAVVCDERPIRPDTTTDTDTDNDTDTATDTELRLQRATFTAQLLSLLHEERDDYDGMEERVVRVAGVILQYEKRLASGHPQPSLIDVNLIDSSSGRDVVMGLSELELALHKLEQRLQLVIRYLLRRCIYPHIFTALAGDGYDVTRKDEVGWSAFTLLMDGFQIGRHVHPATDTDTDAYTYSDSDSDPLYRLVECLLQLGANVEERNPRTLWTPLMTQVWSDNASGMQLLLTHGADVNAQDTHGNTFLHQLVFYQNDAKLRQLCVESENHMMKVDYTIENNEGETAIQMAERRDAHAQLGDMMRKQQAKAKEIATLLKQQRDKQRQFILDAIDPYLMPDLAAIIVSYFYSKDKNQPERIGTSTHNAESESGGVRV